MSADHRTLDKTYLYLAVAWGFFGGLHVLQGHPLHGWLAVGESAIILMVYSVRHRIGSDPTAHLVMGLCVAGFFVASLLSGQGASVSLWWMALLPVMAGYMLGGRAARGWLAVVVVAMTLVHMSSWWVTIEPELVSTNLDVWARQVVIALLGVLAGTATVSTLRSQRRQLTVARDQAQVAVKARAAFLAGISHELRTPLTGLLGMTELMRQEPEGEGREATIHEIVRNGEVLAQLVEQILEFSRIDEAGADLQEGVFDPRVLLEDAIMASAPTAWDKGLTLTHVVDPSVEGLIRCDGQRLRQVMSNLVNNAVKYTQEGFVHVHVGHTGEWLEVTVEDSGPGLTREEVTLALVPFKRLSHGSIPGTGLGLPSVHAWCRSMGGDLRIESQPGRGSTFTARVVASVVAHASLEAPPPEVDIAEPRLRDSVASALTTLQQPASAHLVDGLVEVTTPRGVVRLRWPARLQRRSSEDVLPASTRKTSPARRVVVVDDVPVIRTVVCRLVQASGAEVVAFDNGTDALTHLQGHEVDLVLLDMWLTNEQGPDVARRIHAQWPDLRVVAMSASVQAEDQRAWHDAGVSEFLPKPIDVQALDRILQG